MFNCFRFDIRSSFKFQVSSFRFHPSLFTVHYSLAKRCFALSPRLLRAEGPSAPCAWPASAVRVTLDVSAAKLLHCHCGSRIQPSVSHFSLITHHFSLITSFGHLVIWSFVKIENGCCQNRHYNINILFIYSEQITAFPKSKMTILTLTVLTTILTIIF